MSFVSDIYFLDARSLALELKNGTFSEYRAVKHLLTTFVLSGFGFTIPLTATFEKTEHALRDNLASATVFIVVGVITFYGTWLTYSTHMKGDRKDYFLRFAALSLPVGLRLTLVFLLVMAVLLVSIAEMSPALGPNAPVAYYAAYFVAACTYTTLFFARMRTYLAIAGSVSDSTAV